MTNVEINTNITNLVLECYNCGQKSHFAKVCQTRSVTKYHKKVHSVTQHDSYLMQVLKRARNRNLKLNRNKCQIKKDAITYIGHILSKDGVKPDPKKIEAIVNTPCPDSREELQRFLGMLTYLSKFIPNLSHIASPLWTLLEKNVEWHWQAEQAYSFRPLKELITTTPVLKYFNSSKPMKLSADASSKGL